MSARDATESIQQLLLSLEKLSPRLEGRQEDLHFLKNMLQSNEFHSLLKVHQEVTTATSIAVDPLSHNALTLAHMVSYDLEVCPDPEAQELFDLLTSPHMDSLISTHDRVVNKEYPLQSVAMETTDSNVVEEQPVTTVRIKKERDPLGATVKTSIDGSVLISRILCGGAADKSGLLHSGDIIHEINGQSVKGFSVNEVADLMQGLTGTVVFKITPSVSEFRPTQRRQPPVYMRTYFSYNPANDRHAPCPEAGLKFERGDILHIMNQEDPDWWQAVREGQERNRAGIIPSKIFRERLQCYDNTQQQQQQYRRKTKGKKMSTYDSKVHGKEIVTYEEMVKVEPQVNRPRPIMLVAPRGAPFDMEGLRARLIIEKPERFGAPLTHTSRSPHSYELNGQHYFFVSRQKMERDIQNNQFVEHGYLDGDYYGTSVNSIRDVTNSGKTCLLVLIPAAMKVARIPELKPFIVYFRPPSTDFMRQHWLPKKAIRESSIADIHRQAGYLEKTYSHYFDHTITFTDMETVRTQFLRVADRLMQDHQWVPATWTT